MATSEYLRGGGRHAGRAARPATASSAHPSAWLRASAVTALPILLGDVLSLIAALVGAYLVRVLLFSHIKDVFDVGRSLGSVPTNIAYFSLFAVLYLFVARRYGLYGPTLKNSLAHELRMTIQACFVSGLMLGGFLFLTRNLFVSRALLVLYVLGSIGALSLTRLAGHTRRRTLYKRGVSTRRIAIVGGGHLGPALFRHLRKQPELGYAVRGFILPRHERRCTDLGEAPVLGSLDELGVIVRRHFLDEVILADVFPQEEVLALLADARELRFDVSAIAGYYNDLAVNSGIESLGAFPVVSLHRSAPRLLALIAKRAGDILFSLAALAATAPIMLAIAVAVRMDGVGPIFYKSERIGRRGAVFPCFKFRTMVPDADRRRRRLAAHNERDGVLFKMANDPRITRVGRFLRKYSLDELPQFFNVLRGEMSLVGPRPPLASEVEQYKLEHMRRLEVVPGMTGLWQIEARRDSSFERYIALDTAYVENWSFWLDLKILARTADVVLRGTGI